MALARRSAAEALAKRDEEESEHAFDVWPPAPRARTGRAPRTAGPGCDGGFGECQIDVRARRVTPEVASP